MWRTNDVLPEEPGWYAVTRYTAMMCDSGGGSSFAWITEADYFDGDFWMHGGSIAWDDLPAPYVPKEERERLFENMYKDEMRYLEHQNELNNEDERISNMIDDSHDTDIPF